MDLAVIISRLQADVLMLQLQFAAMQADIAAMQVHIAWITRLLWVALPLNLLANGLILRNDRKGK